MRKLFLFAAVTLVIVAFALIVALYWAIVTGRAKRQRADVEYHTEQNIRTIYHAEREYYVNNEHLGFTCSFSTLTAQPDHFLYTTFSSGHVDGYTYTFSNCKHEENVGFNGNLTYQLTATPDPGITTLPLPTYCVDDDVDSIPRGEYVEDRPRIVSSAPGSSDCAHADQ
jgi:hypothetical protein